MLGSARLRRNVLFSLIVAGVAAVLAPAASAYRSPTNAERQAVVRAFDKHHGSKAKKLNIEQIRVSAVNSRYFAVLFNDKTVVGGKTYTFGPTTLEYYVRPKGGASDAGARRAMTHGIMEKLNFLGPRAPASVEDDEDPLYDVTYRTTPHAGGETVTRDVNHAGCGMSHSEGTYHWFVIWKGIQLTLPNLPPSSVQSVDFTGSVTWNDPCPTRSKYGSQCRANGKITYSGGGDSTLATGSGSLIPLDVSAGATDDLNYYCADIVELAAVPITGVEIKLPFHANGHAFADRTFDVDTSNFTQDQKDTRLDNCDRGEAGVTCSERATFHGEIIAQRHYRVPH